MRRARRLRWYYRPLVLHVDITSFTHLSGTISFTDYDNKMCKCTRYFQALLVYICQNRTANHDNINDVAGDWTGLDSLGWLFVHILAVLHAGAVVVVPFE